MRSVFFNVFQSVIVLLYVMDNETNTVVIISCFVGLLIEIWKINKAVDVKVSVPDLKGVLILSQRLFSINALIFSAYLLKEEHLKQKKKSQFHRTIW